MNTARVAPPLVLTPEAIAALPEEPLGSLHHVTHRVLWRRADSMAGVLTVDGGHSLGRHAHRVNEHHMWVLAGEAVVLGQRVGPGAHVHGPGPRSARSSPTVVLIMPEARTRAHHGRDGRSRGAKVTTWCSTAPITRRSTAPPGG